MTRIHFATVTRAGAAAALALSLTACLVCKTSDGDVYTLYRNSIVQGGNDARIHVATFDVRSVFFANVSRVNACSSFKKVCTGDFLPRPA